MESVLPNVIALLIVGAIVWGILQAARPRPLFTVRIANGEPHAVHGRVTGAFLDRVREVAAAHRIQRGLVFGVASNGRIRLKTSGHFPPAAQQQLRNWWAEFGWPVPRSRRRP
ncbi:hypothetical protein GobsT_33690 [Gemmata obscuriglobus]|uniref:DUF3634 domain-containing protein n=1 Tax=Gemmata obscuriglobus TaxID=114 RepID=A0A2Z3H424_9BACT|nr:DUF3634 family protein [Gemmata obscuriglobus]AWM38477.1 DUF3634 domain-containing protein [Gemmata obscuriglobus]QEG28586.1 hypothetical protein GobsT_33690 [Gemmata obscuriglobus]VTS06726.1 : DUF3634 [Gemmata obscuriglobus UQM 2246]